MTLENSKDDEHVSRCTNHGSDIL